MEAKPRKEDQSCNKLEFSIKILYSWWPLAGPDKALALVETNSKSLNSSLEIHWG